jgi:hypothetical protein
MGSSVSSATRRRRGRAAAPLLTGLVVGAAVLAGALPLLDRYEQPWEASSTLLVLPRETLSPELAAGYYEQLNGGRVVATYAELLQQQDFVREPRAAGGDAPVDVAVDVAVVTDTLLLRVTATATAARPAEEAAQHAGTMAVRYVRGLDEPFRLALTSRALGGAERAGVPHRTLLVVLAVVALACAVAAQQLHLLLARARSRRSQPSVAPQARRRRPPAPPTPVTTVASTPVVVRYLPPERAPERPEGVAFGPAASSAGPG